MDGREVECSGGDVQAVDAGALDAPSTDERVDEFINEEDNEDVDECTGDVCRGRQRPGST